LKKEAGVVNPGKKKGKVLKLRLASRGRVLEEGKKSIIEKDDELSKHDAIQGQTQEGVCIKEKESVADRGEKNENFEVRGKYSITDRGGKQGTNGCVSFI